MFAPIPDSELKKARCKLPCTSEEVQYSYLRNTEVKNTVTCWIPPVGWIWSPLENDGEGGLIYIGVEKRSTNPKNCYWEIDKRFQEYKVWEKWEIEQDEVRDKKKNPNYIHPQLLERHDSKFEYIKTISDLETFKKYCWERRLGGHWYSNNGVPTYITGHHWYYLSVYKMDDGAPSYRDVDRKHIFYYWEWNVQNPKSYGVMLVGGRRLGKSFSGGSIILERTTSRVAHHGGIQSTTESTASDFFKKCIIYPFRSLPKFFKPLCNLPKGDKFPAQGLIFDSGKMGSLDNDLMSWIDFKASAATAYDHSKLNTSYEDEVFKTIEINIYDRWNVKQATLRNYKGEIIGKHFGTSTVENIEGKIDIYREFWADSNPATKTGNSTVTGLYKMFIPAYYYRAIDKFGISDVEEGKKIILSELESLRSNPQKFNSWKRQNPFCEEEAFNSDATKCVYHNLTIKITDRLDEVTYSPPAYKTYDLAWEDNIPFTRVIPKENPEGRFKIPWLPPEQYLNNVECRGGKYYPKNSITFMAATDPFDVAKVAKSSAPKASDGCNIIRKRPDVMMPCDLDFGVVMFYLARPASPEIFYEDCLKSWWLFGCKSLIETNKSGLEKWLEANNCMGFMEWLPGKDKPGIYTNSSYTAQQIVDLTSQFIYDHIDTIVFKEILEDWLKFEPDNTQPYDAAMTFGYSEMLMRMPSNIRAYQKLNQTNNGKSKDIKQIFRFLN